MLIKYPASCETKMLMSLRSEVSTSREDCEVKPWEGLVLIEIERGGASDVCGTKIVSDVCGTKIALAHPSR